MEFNMDDYQFEGAWCTDACVQWQRDCRAVLNSIIDEYNAWQIKGFQESEKRQLLAMITYGIQTIGSEDGGSGYREVLDRMMAFVLKERG